MDFKLIFISVAYVYLVTPAAASSLEAQDAVAEGVGLSGASLRSKRSFVYYQTQSGVIQAGIPVKNEHGDIIGVLPAHTSFFDKICNMFRGISTLVSKKMAATGDFISSLFGQPQYVMVKTTTTTTTEATTTTKKHKCPEHGRRVDEADENENDEDKNDEDENDENEKEDEVEDELEPSY